MERITQKDLEYLVKRINEVTGSPMSSYTQTQKAILASENQKYQRAVVKGNIDNYHLDYAYGGVQLVRMGNESGGIETISRRCHVPKRELYNWMQAFLAGHAAK